MLFAQRSQILAEVRALYLQLTGATHAPQP